MRSLVREASYGSVRVFWLDRERAVTALRDAARLLIAERPEVEQVVLFGSLAEGRAVPGSDADLLVVTRLGAPWLERNLVYRAYLDGCGIGVDVFAYRPEEIEDAPMARRALRTGVVLAARRS